METLEYSVIKTKKQYKEYTHMLEGLLNEPESKYANDRIDLLTLLVETWDKEHNTFSDLNPVELLEGLMEEHGLKATHLAYILGVSKGLVSDILNYNKGFSKEIIRKLAQYFKVSQEAFNREYKLKTPTETTSQKSSKKSFGLKPSVFSAAKKLAKTHSKRTIFITR